MPEQDASQFGPDELYLSGRLQGEQAAAMKADIAASARLAGQNPDLSPEARVVARGLLDIHGLEK